MQDVVQQGLRIFLEAILLGIIASLSIRPARTDSVTGDLILRYSGMILFLAWSGFLLMIAGFGLPIFYLHPADLLYGWIILGMTLTALSAVAFGIFAVYVTWSRVLMNDEGLTQHSAFHFQRAIAWADVEQISFSPTMDWFVVRSREGEKIRVAALLSGALEFRDQVKVRLPQTAYEQAREGFGKIGPSGHS